MTVVLLRLIDFFMFYWENISKTDLKNSSCLPNGKTHVLKKFSMFSHAKSVDNRSDKLDSSDNSDSHLIQE